MQNKSFKDRVLDVVAQIPKGSTLSYKEVAILAGSPRAFRAVGTILKGNFNDAIPCHRVILSSGNMGNYNRGSALKKHLLLQEGAQIFKI